MKNTFAVLVFLFSISANCQFQSLSKNSQISVLTIAPGPNLNDAFGHSAFRVLDYDQETDIIFDYGRYDFNAPNFYLNFTRGKLNYQLGASRFDNFLNFYKEQQRDVTEQILDLTYQDKLKLYRYLVNNYKPENRNYKYDFFYENCATKIKDVLQKNTKEKIVFNTLKTLKKSTFRDLIHEHVAVNTWGCFGIDLALGSVIDEKIPAENYMFLPKYIEVFFGNASLDNKPLVSQTNKLLDNKATQQESNFFISPLFLFSLLSVFILWLTYKDFKSQKRNRILDVFIFSVTGFIGFILLLLWFATDHTATAYNYNLLWAFFLNIFVLQAVFSKKPKKWFRKYVKFLIILLVLMALHWIMQVQKFSITILPFYLALLLRYLFISKILNTRLHNSN